jgi:hypothetical protein
MGIADLVKTRYTIMPGRQSITYYVEAAGGTWGAGATVTDVEKRPLSAEDQLAAGIGLEKQGCQFIVWNAQTSATPRQGDKLVDAGSVTWHVKRVDEELLGERFRLTCTKENA